MVVIAPRPDAGAFAGAARAALENLARTLSVEWARYGITATVITPGNATTDDQIAQLVVLPGLARGRLLQRLPVLAGRGRVGRLSDPRRQPSAQVVEHLLALGLVEDLVVQALRRPSASCRTIRFAPTSITLPCGGHSPSSVPYMISVGTVIAPTASGNDSIAAASSTTVRAGSLPWCTSGSDW